MIKVKLMSHNVRMILADVTFSHIFMEFFKIVSIMNDVRNILIFLFWWKNAFERSINGKTWYLLNKKLELLRFHYNEQWKWSKLAMKISNVNSYGFSHYTIIYSLSILHSLLVCCVSVVMKCELNFQSSLADELTTKKLYKLFKNQFHDLL